MSKSSFLKIGLIIAIAFSFSQFFLSIPNSKFSNQNQFTDSLKGPDLILNPKPSATGVFFGGIFDLDDDSNSPSFGNGDSLIDAGETIELKIKIRNNESFALTNTYVNMNAEDGNITMLSDTIYFGVVDADSLGLSVNYFLFSVEIDCPANQTIELSLNITANEGSWIDSFNISVCATNTPRFSHIVILEEYDGDIVANHNGIPDPGEIVDFAMMIENDGNSNLSNLTCTILEADPYVNIFANFGEFGNVNQSAIANATSFSMIISLACPENYSFVVNFSFDDALGHHWNSNGTLFIGKSRGIFIEDVYYNSYSNCIIPGSIIWFTLNITNDGYYSYQNITIGCLNITNLKPIYSISYNLTIASHDVGVSENYSSYTWYFSIYNNITYDVIPNITFVIWSDTGEVLDSFTQNILYICNFDFDQLSVSVDYARNYYYNNAFNLDFNFCNTALTGNMIISLTLSLPIAYIDYSITGGYVLSGGDIILTRNVSLSSGCWTEETNDWTFYSTSYYGQSVSFYYTLTLGNQSRTYYDSFYLYAMQQNSENDDYDYQNHSSSVFPFFGGFFIIILVIILVVALIVKKADLATTTNTAKTYTTQKTIKPAKLSNAPSNTRKEILPSQEKSPPIAQTKKLPVCPLCRSEIPTEAVFCPNCGNRI